MKAGIALAILVAIIPVTAHAGQVTIPTVSTPHLSIGSNTSGAGAGKVKFNDIHFTSKTDKSTAALPAVQTNVKSPRDASSGLPTGKRMH